MSFQVIFAEGLAVFGGCGWVAGAGTGVWSESSAAE